MFIKRVDSTTHPDEVKIASRLGSPGSREDPGNHCVPILAVFSDGQDPRYQYIVMPVLRPFDEPNFTSFGEVVDFVNQTLEVCPICSSTYICSELHVQGLVYIHDQNVAHRWVDVGFAPYY